MTVVPMVTPVPSKRKFSTWQSPGRLPSVKAPGRPHGEASPRKTAVPPEHAATSPRLGVAVQETPPPGGAPPPPATVPGSGLTPSPNPEPRALPPPLSTGGHASHRPVLHPWTGARGGGPAARKEGKTRADEGGGAGSRPRLLETHSPVFAYLKKPSLLDFPGHVAVVFFTAGCNMHCGFCHNITLLGNPRPGMTWSRLDTVCRIFRNHWAGGAVISGGEPTLQPELPRLVALLHRHGFAVKLDTNGSQPDVLAAHLDKFQYVAMDFKCRLERYEAMTGFGETAAIARSIALLKAGQVPYEFRTTVIDGVHDAAEIRAMGELAAGAARFVLQPFLPHEDLPDPALRTVKRTHREQLDALAAILRDYVPCVEIRGA